MNRVRIVLFVLALMLGMFIVGCALEANCKATAFNGRIEQGSQTTLSVGRAARD